jgi:hypothetical protein
MVVACTLQGRGAQSIAEAFWQATHCKLMWLHAVVFVRVCGKGKIALPRCQEHRDVRSDNGTGSRSWRQGPRACHDAPLQVL